MIVPTTPPRLSLWAELITENPLRGDAAREQRRFFRFSNLGPIGRWIVLVCFILFYGWLFVIANVTASDGTLGWSIAELVVTTIFLTGSIYGAISGEREKATWDALILTRLTPAQIIIGKFMWRVRLIGILIALFAIVIVASRSGAATFNITTVDAIAIQLLILSWCLFVAGLGLWISSITKRSIISLTLLSSILIGMLGVIPGLYGILASSASPGWNTTGNPDAFFNFTMSFNPFVPLLDLANPQADALRGTLHLGWPQYAAYIAGSACLIALTYRRLRKLEEPDK